MSGRVREAGMSPEERRATKRAALPESRVSSGGQGPEEPSPAAATAADRLSSLPDEVLLSIVSHLSVREVVRMSILSGRWRHLPSLLPVIDHLDLSSRRREEEEGEEFDWVAHWGLIQRCVFSPPRSEESKNWAFDQWAQDIAGKGVRELELSVDDEYFNAYPILHYCKSLVKLKLICCSLWGGILRCTGLRELELEYVHLCEDLLQDLISNCVHLETLRIWDCPEFGRLRITAAPSLRCLEFGYHNPDMALGVFECDGIVVDTPNLERAYICVVPWWCEEFTIRSPKLTSLRIHLIEEEEGFSSEQSDEEGIVSEKSEEEEIFAEKSEDDRFLLEDSDEYEFLEKERPPHPCRVVAGALRKLLNGPTKFRSLQLYGTSIRCLSVDVPPKRFCPSFVSLTSLSVELPLKDDEQASRLAMLLQHCKRLRKLKLFVRSIFTRDDPSRKEVPFRHVIRFWEHRRMLVRMGSLSRRLQEVTMYGLTGEIYEMELACFFLMEARVLKKLSLFFREDYREEKKIMAMHLPNLRRGSSEVEVELDVADYTLY